MNRDTLRYGVSMLAKYGRQNDGGNYPSTTGNPSGGGRGNGPRK